MKHFLELDEPKAIHIISTLPSLAAANEAARRYVTGTGRTAITYSHNKHGHAINRRTFKRGTGGKVETRRF